MFQMTFKFIGAVFVIAACALIGYKKGESFVIRAEILAEIVTMLRSIKNNILYKKDTTAKAINNALMCENLRHISFTIDEDNTPNFPGLLKKSLSGTEKVMALYLSKHEIAEFFNMLYRLGGANAKEETQKLEYTALYFDNLQKKADENAKVQLKLYKSLGFAAGAAIVLLFI